MKKMFCMILIITVLVNAWGCRAGALQENEVIQVHKKEGFSPSQYSEDFFTFVIESDTQYYNEDYDGNPDQKKDGNYEHQLNIHNWILKNRKALNIQYLFHNGDIIDDMKNKKEWEQADSAYKLLDEASLPYGVLAGNHDVGHEKKNYTNFGRYFGEERFSENPWYGESYKNNRCHYDLIDAGGIEFIMIYAGWGITDDDISWMKQILETYPERRAILNFHEYLKPDGTIDEEGLSAYEQVVSQYDNVCMVLSGHFPGACTRADKFINADGSERTVYSLLFDGQSLAEGGMGYIRLLEFDLNAEKVTVRSYSPSLDDWGSAVEGDEELEIGFEALGIEM